VDAADLMNWLTWEMTHSGVLAWRDEIRLTDFDHAARVAANINVAIDVGDI
jgi:hypothetical protein